MLYLDGFGDLLKWWCCCICALGLILHIGVLRDTLELQIANRTTMPKNRRMDAVHLSNCSLLCYRLASFHSKLSHWLSLLFWSTSKNNSALTTTTILLACSTWRPSKHSSPFSKPLITPSLCVLDLLDRQYHHFKIFSCPLVKLITFSQHCHYRQPFPHQLHQTTHSLFGSFM